ncbi:MAG: fused MFS/spermidine synthase [Steroidobacteraceae bacterium]
MSAFSRYLFTCLCVGFSGLAALIYQIAWTRQFALVFGTSELAVATVLAAYMGGLALGARCIEPLLIRISRPARMYALLEAGIAAAALLWVPLCLWAAEYGLAGLLGGQAAPPDSTHVGTTVFYLVTAFITLLVPTALMGATLPLLVRDGVHTEQQIGRRVGALYVANTAGAVVGALLAALYLLPQLGLRATTWTAATINLLVAALAYQLTRSSVSSPEAAQATPATEAVTPKIDKVSWSRNHWILPLMLLSGVVSFLHEVLWTRMLAHVMGSSIIAFGVMVASFLLGIALGGALGSWLARNQPWAIRSWSATQLLSAVMAMLAWYAIQHWAPASATLLQKAGFGLIVLLPLAIAIGATYPLAVRILAAQVADAAPVSARVYAWNTLGAIVGALAGGFWLIPALRYEGSVQLAVVASALLAVASALLWLRLQFKWMVPLLAMSAMVGIAFRPQVPESILRLSPLRSGTGSLEYYAVGRGADVVVLRDDQTLDLRTNGLPEAGIDVLGSPPSLNLEAWMSPLAVLARPQTQSMLVVGFGGGNAVQAVPPSVRQIDVIELEPEVIAANQAVSKLRARNPLLDSRVNIVLNDARGALLLTDKKYDAVVSQPSHPWTAGASHLYTLEFMQQVRAHLNPGGVFVQWMSTDFMDESLLRSLLATLTTAFPEVRVYRTSPNTFLFMGSEQPIEPERQFRATRSVLLSAQTHYSRIGINAVEDLLAALVLDTVSARALAQGSAIITDDNNRLATSGVYDFKRAMGSAAAGRLLAAYDPMTQVNSFVYQQLAPSLSFDYLWRHIATWMTADASTAERLNRMTALFGDSELAAYLQVVTALRANQPTLANQQLAAALRRWPDSQLLNYALLEPYLAKSFADLPPEVANATRRLVGEPALVAAAVRLATQEKWGELASLDAQLEQIPWTAPWYTQAAQLRIEWRARVGNKELRPRYGTEAIAIADRVLLNQPDGFWYALRALNAVGTDQPQLMLESVAAFARLALERGKALSGEERLLAKDRAAQLMNLLDQLQSDSRIDNQRWRQIRERLIQAQAALG